MMAVRCTSKSH